MNAITYLFLAALFGGYVWLKLAARLNRHRLPSAGAVVPAVGVERPSATPPTQQAAQDPT